MKLLRSQAGWQPSKHSATMQTRRPEEILRTIKLGQTRVRHPLHGHSYARFTSLRPRACSACQATIWGPFAISCHCLSCGIVVHRRCAARLTISPCGNYRGLTDPQGRNSPRSSRHASRADSRADDPPQLASPRLRRERTSDSGAGPGGGDEPTKEPPRLSLLRTNSWTSSMSRSSSLGDGSPRAIREDMPRRSTLEALSLAGVKITGTATSLTAVTLRGAGGLMAGAYSGFTKARSGSSDNLGRDSPRVNPADTLVARGWAEVAVKLWQQQKAGKRSCVAFVAFEQKLSEERRQSSELDLIDDVLACAETAPGLLWWSCWWRFRRRHPEYLHGERSDEGTGDAPGDVIGPEGGFDTGSCCEDARCIAEQVTRVLLHYVPGLRASQDMVEATMEAVDRIVSARLYAAAFNELSENLRELCQSVECWCDGDDGGPAPCDNNEGLVAKAALELRAMEGETTGLGKVRRALAACMALTEGNGGGDVAADELLPLLGRAVRHARLKSLPVQLAYVDEMCDASTLLGAEGYAFTSLQVVLNLIVQPPDMVRVRSKDSRGSSSLVADSTKPSTPVDAAIERVVMQTAL